MFSNGVYSYPKPETSKPSQNKPQTFLTESHVAETAEATSDHLSTDDDEETHKEPRPVSPHIFQIDPTTLNMTATSEPVTPEPSPKSQPKPTPKTPPESEPPHSGPSPNNTLHDSVVMNETSNQQTDHENVDNSLFIVLADQHLQNLSRTLDTDHVEQSPPHNSELNTYMDNLEKECIPSESGPKDSDNQAFFPQNLPKKILSQPPSSTQNDIEHLLKAVNKNIRRLGNSLPDMSIDSAHISDECKFMK
ncbi:hypothetical protein QL285_094021 [Trifolium repens]|nr:hypothetical protein QL285_094021 [Trifolium repens]